MIILDKENLRMVDVDDTLVMHRTSQYDCLRSVVVKDPLGGPSILLDKNFAMIRLIKEEHARGATIVVWSRGGYQWAKNVVEALKLESYVTMIMSKPTIYFDDKPVEEWLKDRVYIGPNEKYKGT
jgi:hypothetical protein